MPFPLAPHHVQLVAACYPPSSALPTSGPDYKPNPQELSKLTYYASNRPGKIAKLGSELEKRVLADARKAKSGNVRARATLLITLNIMKALTTECRRDLTLLSASLMSSLNATLGALPNDLEVVAKVASVFAAWAAYTSGQLLGVDQNLTRDYLSLLRGFSTLCTVEAKNNDEETRNRTRLVGLGALTGAVASDALYNSTSQFRSQVFILVPALLINIMQTSVPVLELGTESINGYKSPLSEYLAEFRSRPLLERRAASIHIHVDGDSGPSDADVANAAIKAFTCLFGQANGNQTGLILLSIFESLGTHDYWKDKQRCCWLIQRIIEWTQYQYRFAIPTRLVERLVEAQEDPRPSDLHRSLAAMIKAALNAPTPLASLSTSDVCSSLTALILRRVALNANDELLPELVECVGALGTHIYYADQIHDLVCEIIGRLVHIDSYGIGGKSRLYGQNDSERETALRCLIACLGLLVWKSSKPLHYLAPGEGHPAEHSEKHSGFTNSVTEGVRAGACSPSPSDASSVRAAVPQRSKVPPNVWQETLTLLCDECFSVRSEYSRTLVLYLRSELHPELGCRSGATDVSSIISTSRPKSVDDKAFQRARTSKSSVLGDIVSIRFFHALFALIYILATSPRLSLPPSSSSTPAQLPEIEISRDGIKEPIVNVTPSTPLNDQSFTNLQDEGITGNNHEYQLSRNKSINLTPQSRRLLRMRKLLDKGSRRESLSDAPENTTACLSDFLHIMSIFDAINDQTPARTLIIGFPMILALRKWCETVCTESHRKAVVRHTLKWQLHRISRAWDCSELQELLKDIKLSASFPYPPNETYYPSREDALELSSANLDEEDVAFLEPSDESLISTLAKNTNIQYATGLDEEDLMKRLGIFWNVEDALQNSVEPFMNGDSSRPDHGNPLLKISPALMHISNLSLQSLARSNHGVGVNDLREALEGRGGISNLALSQERTPSVISMGATHSGASGDSSILPSPLSVNRPRPRVLSGENPNAVKDVLDRLGIGAQKTVGQSNSATSRQVSNPKSVMIPPYKG